MVKLVNTTIGPPFKDNFSRKLVLLHCIHYGPEYYNMSLFVTVEPHCYRIIWLMGFGNVGSTSLVKKSVPDVMAKLFISRRLIVVKYKSVQVTKCLLLTGIPRLCNTVCLNEAHSHVNPFLWFCVDKDLFRLKRNKDQSQPGASYG